MTQDEKLAAAKKDVDAGKPVEATAKKWGQKADTLYKYRLRSRGAGGRVKSASTGPRGKANRVVVRSLRPGQDFLAVVQNEIRKVEAEVGKLQERLKVLRSLL